MTILKQSDVTIRRKTPYIIEGGSPPPDPNVLISENYEVGIYTQADVPVFSGLGIGVDDDLPNVTLYSDGNGYNGSNGFVQYLLAPPGANGREGFITFPSPYSEPVGSNGGEFFAQFKLKFGAESRFQGLDQIKLFDSVGSNNDGYRPLLRLDSVKTPIDNNCVIRTTNYGDGVSNSGEAHFAALAMGLGDPCGGYGVTFNIFYAIQIHFKAESASGAGDGFIKVYYNNNNQSDPNILITGSIIYSQECNSHFEFGGINFNNGGSGLTIPIINDDFQMTDSFVSDWWDDGATYDSFEGIRWEQRFDGSLEPYRGTVPTAIGWSGGNTGFTLRNVLGHDTNVPYCLEHIVTPSDVGTTAEARIEHNFGNFPFAAVSLADPHEYDLIVDFYHQFGSDVESNAITWPQDSMKLCILQTHQRVNNQRHYQIYIYIDSNGRYAIDYSDTVLWNFNLVPVISGNAPYPARNSYDHIQFRGKLNTIGLSDGIVQGWINGVKYWESTNLNLRGSDSESWNRIIPGYYATGDDEPGWRESTETITFRQSGYKMFCPNTVHNPDYTVNG